VLNESLLQQYGLSGDESGYSSSYKTIGIDQLDTGTFLSDFGATVSAGRVTIPLAARTGKTLWRAMASVWSNDNNASYCTLRFSINFDGTTTLPLIHQTRHALGSNFRWTLMTGWMPFETDDVSVALVERADSGAHSIEAANTVLQVEVI
jgi:hypothetical protein